MPEIPQYPLLNEADPEQSISELLARDPLTMTDDQIDLIVAKLQEQRRRWALVADKPKPRAAKSKKSVSLSDYGL